MKRLLFFIVLMVSPVFAQYTTVTGTVKDASGLPYSNGTVLPSLSVSLPVVNGQGYTPPSQVTPLDSNGVFSVVLPANAIITPSGSTWSFKVCSGLPTLTPPLGTGNQCFTVSAVTISGRAQDISATLSTSAIALSNISTSGGVGSGAGPVMAYYLAPQCPAANSGQCFQTPANTQVVQTCGFNTGTTTVTCASGTFAATDVGKFIWGFDSCNPFLAQPRGVVLTNSHDTITAFISSTQVTVSAVGAAGTIASTGCVVFGTPDDTAAAAVDAAFASLASVPVCPKLFLSAAQYMFTTGHFFTNPVACGATPAQQQGGSLGNLFYSSGFEVEGRGPAATILWQPPDFPETGNCNHGSAAVGCWVVPLEARFSNFQISCGAGNCLTPAGRAVMEVDGPASLEYFTCTGVGDFSSNNRIGVQAISWSQLQQVNISACGDTGLMIGNSAQAALVTGFRVASENSNGVVANSANLLMTDANATFDCYDCKFFGNQSQQVMSDIVQTGGTIRLFHPTIQTDLGTNQFAYQCITTGPCKFTVTDGIFTKNGTTNQTGIFCNVQCTVDLLRSPVVGFGTGSALNITNAASILINRGGNSFTGGAASVNSGFTLNLDAEGLVGITAAKAVLSGGWGTTAAWTVLTGGNSFTGTITASGTGQGANPTITYTFPSPLPISYVPYCSAAQTGGTQAAGTFVATSVSATGVTFTYSGTPIAANTIFVQVFCQ